MGQEVSPLESEVQPGVLAMIWNYVIRMHMCNR